MLVCFEMCDLFNTCLNKKITKYKQKKVIFSCNLTFIFFTFIDNMLDVISVF